MSRESIVTWADGTTGKVTFSEYGSSSNAVPMNPDLQRIAAQERASWEVEMNTPENRQKAAEAEVAERERKKIDFHFRRSIPQFLEEGWKHLQQELTEQEIRVYTTDYERRRFWGIKPAGMGMSEFWESNDPEIARFDDNIAMTWADPLVPPPTTALNEDMPVIWVGRGLNPDLTPPAPPVADEAAPTRAPESRRRQKTPEVGPAHRVRKPKAPSRKTKKKSIHKPRVDEADADQSKLDDQILQEQNFIPAIDGPSRNNQVSHPPAPRHESAPKDQLPNPSKRPQRHPPHGENPTPAPASSAPQPPKRPRGRPPKVHPAATKGADTSSPKRPRGRPPGKGGKPTAAAVQGNARITKSSTSQNKKQKAQHASAPSTHGMRTRGKGNAKLLQLP